LLLIQEGKNFMAYINALYSDGLIRLR